MKRQIKTAMTVIIAIQGIIEIVRTAGEIRKALKKKRLATATINKEDEAEATTSTTNDEV